MTLAEHLVELRKRLVISVIATLVAGVVGWFLADLVWGALSEPVLEIAQERNRDAEINYTTVSEAFDTKIAIALTLGIVIASPVWLYQIWAYFVPALVRQERRYAIGFLAAAIPLFAAGATTGPLVGSAWSFLLVMVWVLCVLFPQRFLLCPGCRRCWPSLMLVRCLSLRGRPPRGGAAARGFAGGAVMCVGAQG